MTRRLDCDLILEGAVTSAVVYLALVAGLSERYRFRSLGGTSSGAAVAATAALAESSRRDSGKDEAFAGILDFARDLGNLEGGRTRLMGLFQPAPALRWPFLLLVRLFGGTGRAPGLVFIMACLTAIAAFGILLLTLLGLCFDGFEQSARQHLIVILGVASTLGKLAIALVLMLLLCALRWLRALRANHFGFCSGMPTAYGHTSKALTPRLHELFNKLRGRGEHDDPVTFGMLWQERGREPNGERSIDLQVVTTVLQQRRSLHLPGKPGEDPLRDYFYDPEEWRLLFPEPVLDWLRRHARQTVPVEVERREAGRTSTRTLLALPEPRDLPVIVAVRLSVSFPGLLSAAPLYTLAQGHGFVRNTAQDPASFRPVRVYFTDGGLTSNLPVDLFDAALPSRPTFGVNLFELDPDRSGTEDGQDVFFGARRNEPETRPEALTPGADERPGLLAFVWELISTMQNWRDTTQRTLPGIRERVLHIGLPAGYGSLNLAMSPQQLEDLVSLGTRAAQRVANDFSLPAEPGKASGWEEHRWLRLRTTLAAMQDWLRPIATASASASASPPTGTHLDGELAYRELLTHPCPPGPAFLDPRAIQQAASLLSAMESAGQAVERSTDLGANLPEGAPRLRLGPPP
jgi:predicted acylesterase/phospholipase RssA